MTQLRLRSFTSLLVLPALAGLIACGGGGKGDDGTGGTSGTGGAAGAAGGGTGGEAGSGGMAMGGAAGMGGSVSMRPNDFGDRVPVTDTMPSDLVTHPVDVVRDQWGWTHIYASSLDDAFAVQGYMVAKDRSAQLDLLRRTANGSIAEVFGGLDPSQVEMDITMRSIGLKRIADDEYAEFADGSEIKRIFDSFTRGVNARFALIRDGSVDVAGSWFGWGPQFFTDWTPQDSVAMGRVQAWNLSYDADTDVSFTRLWNDVLGTYNSSAVDPLVLKRANYAMEALRYAPIDPATPLPGYPDESSFLKHVGLVPVAKRAAANPIARALDVPGVVAPKPIANPTLLEKAEPYLRSVQRAREMFGYSGEKLSDRGSNNWVAHGSVTDTGNPIVANDPHLSLFAPAVFWPVHIVVNDPDNPSDNIDLAGVSFVGIPGVVLGTNGKIAWGATTTGYDVTDVYQETVSADGQGVMFQGSQVDFQRIPQTLNTGSGTYDFDVLVVPHHGPIIPEIDSNFEVVPPTAASGTMSVQWTGNRLGHVVEGVFEMVRANDVDEARQALTKFDVGGQNWLIADMDGNIGWQTHVQVPYRDPRMLTFDPSDYSGTTPDLVQDGASGDFEWERNTDSTYRYLEEQYLPKAKNPAKGWIATANGDNVASTLDNNPVNDTLPNGTTFYLGGMYAQGFRLGRIEERLAADVSGSNTTSLAEMAAIQSDVKSAMGKTIGAEFVAVLERAVAEDTTPGSNPDLAPVVADARYDGAVVADVIDRLKRWNSDADYDALPGVDLDSGANVTDAVEANASIATAIFNAWWIRTMALALEDEAQRLGRSNIGSSRTVRAFVRMVNQTQSTLPTFDAASGESALWDDIDTVPVEKKDEVIGMGLLEALADMFTMFGTADRNEWRWGKLHVVNFSGPVPIWPFGLPQPDDTVFGSSVSRPGTLEGGWPRHGDEYAIDASNYSITRSRGSNLSFDYSSGPVQRFVAEMDPAGMKVRFALPGGAVAEVGHSHFDDQAALWRKNEYHDVALTVDAVAAAYDGVEHIRFVAAP